MLSIPLPPEKSRALEVLIHWRDPTRVPVTYGVFVSSEGKVSDLKAALGPKCGISPKQLKVVQLQGNYIFRYLTNWTPLKMFRSHEVIHAYEVAPGGLQDEKEKEMVMEKLNEKEKSVGNHLYIS